MARKLWKIIRTAHAGGKQTVHALGYPTKGAAEQAAQRLNTTAEWPSGKYHVEPMKGQDYEILAEMEKMQEGL
jgi:hypothetical protein